MLHRKNCSSFSGRVSAIGSHPWMGLDKEDSFPVAFPQTWAYTSRMPVRSTEYLLPAIAADQNDQDTHQTKRLRQRHCDTHQSRLDLRFRIDELVFIVNRQCISVLSEYTGYQSLMPLRHTFFAQSVRRSGFSLMVIPEI